MINNETIDKIVKYNKLYSSYYTNYPPVGEWTEDLIKTTSYKDILMETFSFDQEKKNISLYIHFPYCNSQCYFCHCHTIISKDHQKYFSFLKTLEEELKMFKKLLDKDAINVNIVDIHLGGGSPSGMNIEEFDYLKNVLSTIVDFKNIGEFSIEIDLRFCSEKKMKHFSDEGITRISFGVQDFNEKVQKAINRIQPVSLFNEMVPKTRDMFRGVNFDLIYGMPFQTIKSFEETIENVIKLSPDRISLYRYNHKPSLHKHQGAINSNTLPSETDYIKINYHAIEQLLDNGYLRIGIDHFAKKTDNLGIAALNKNLKRNFLGYTAGGYTYNVGFGPSAMSDLYGFYLQNIYDMKDYKEKIEDEQVPLFRGYKLSKDDIIRREVIYQIMDNFQIDFKELSNIYKIDFFDYFKEEQQQLLELEKDGLLTLNENILEISDVGKYCLRNIAIIFDKIYAQTKQYKYSKDFTS